MVLQGTLGIDGLYVFKGLPLVKRNKSRSSSATSDLSVTHSFSPALHTASAVVTDSPVSLWHARLGHAHLQVVTHVMKHCNIPSVNKHSLVFCNACQLGKSHILHAPPSTITHSLSQTI